LIFQLEDRHKLIALYSFFVFRGWAILNSGDFLLRAWTCYLADFVCSLIKVDEKSKIECCCCLYCVQQKQKISWMECELKSTEQHPQFSVLRVRRPIKHMIYVDSVQKRNISPLNWSIKSVLGERWVLKTYKRDKYFCIAKFINKRKSYPFINFANDLELAGSESHGNKLFF
jgi:hypothetical protein